MFLDTMLHQVFMALLVPGLSQNGELEKFCQQGPNC